MALSVEEQLLQSKILTENTDTNPNMIYKTSSRLNKGLNPEVFSGVNSKIVNAINLLYSMITKTQNTALNLNDKVNSVTLDVDIPTNKEIWDSVVSKLGAVDPTAKTVIQSLDLMLQGKLQANILNLTKEDNGKVLSVFVDELGKVTTKAVSINGGNSDPVTAQDITYTNHDFSSLDTVAKALDYVLSNLNNGGTGQSNPIKWDQISDKPNIVDTLTLNQTTLSINSNSTPISSVPLADDVDITGIINSLDNLV